MLLVLKIKLTVIVSKKVSKIFFKINGKDIKYNLIRNKFKIIKKFLNPIIFNFCIKNLDKIRNFNS